MEFQLPRNGCDPFFFCEADLHIRNAVSAIKCCQAGDGYYAEISMDGRKTACVVVRDQNAAGQTADVIFEDDDPPVLDIPPAFFERLSPPQSSSAQAWRNACSHRFMQLYYRPAYLVGG